MSTLLFIVFIFSIFIACYFLARKDDKILDLKRRLTYLEQKNKQEANKPFAICRIKICEQCFGYA